MRTNLIPTVVVSCAVLLAPLASPTVAEDWLQFHENPLLTGVTNNTAPGPAGPILLWSFTNPSGVAFSSSPAIHDGRVFVGCDDNNLYCFDELTGAVNWSFLTNGAVYSSPAVAGGNVYFGSMDGNLYCVDEIGGVAALFGSVALCGPVWGSPTIVGNDLYIAAQAGIAGVGGQLYSIDRITGGVNWTRVYSGAGMTPLANSYVAVDQGNNLTFSGCHDNVPGIPGDPTMEANTTAGVISWQYYDPLGGFVNCNGAAVDPTFVNWTGGTGQIVFGQHNFGWTTGVVALDELTGMVCWTALPNTDSTSTPAIRDGRVFIGADDNNVYCLDELTGGIIWATPTGGQVWSSPAIADGMVFVGSRDHNLYCLDELTGVINWTYFTGPCRIEASPAVADGIVFVGDSSGTFYAITTKTGVVPTYKWYQPPVPAPFEVFLGWDELSWHGGPQIVADDWPCNNDDEIVSVRWWGSYIGWDEQYPPPPPVPQGFHIAFWTDVPASGGPPEFSHPGYVLYQFQCVPTEVFVGWDYDPRTSTYEATFEYECQLPDPFIQDPGDNIYWISIAAKYPTGPPNYAWGWKTRPRMFQDDAVRIFYPTDPTVDPDYQDGEPIYWPTILDSWDMAFELIAISSGPGIKYSQPPDFISDDPPVINGWDEESVYEYGPWIVGDDWPCDDQRPVTDIHWWGSFLGWSDLDPPTNMPSSFHLGIWTDMPANPPDPSHPDMLLWEYYATNYTLVWVGEDQSPRPDDPMDACFYFTVDLPVAEWFYQEPEQAIYWLTIAAVYDDGPPCRCNADLDEDGDIDAADNGIFTGCYGQPPTGVCENADLDCSGGLIDLNDFSIFSCQLAAGWPDPSCGCPGAQYPFGWKTRPHMFQDDAVRIFDPLAPSPGMVYVDGEPIEYPTGISWDTAFVLTTTGDVEYVKWSQPPEPYDALDHYWGWDEYSVYDEPTDPQQIVADDWRCETEVPVSDVHFWGSFIGWDEPVLPPVWPDAFHIGIWTDQPANPPDEPFSHPDRMIWEYLAGDYIVDFVGWDIDPRYPDVAPQSEACFKFDVDLPIEDWFWQDPVGDPTIYWISIAAQYPVGTIPNYPWGWKTRPHFFQDDAVRIFDPTAPVVGSLYVNGEPIYWPDVENSWDMAFALTTTCTCGDINCSGGPVDLLDFGLFALCYNRTSPGAGCTPEWFTCSDLDGSGWVDLQDYGLFALWYGSSTTQSPPNCVPPP